MIVFDKIGILLSGELKGWNITIQDKTKNTSVYYVIFWNPDDPSNGYENKYENSRDLLISVKDLEIEWTDQDYVFEMPNEDIPSNEYHCSAQQKNKCFLHEDSEAQHLCIKCGHHMCPICASISKKGYCPTCLKEKQKNNVILYSITLVFAIMFLLYYFLVLKTLLRNLFDLYLAIIIIVVPIITLMELIYRIICIKRINDLMKNAKNEDSEI